MEYTESGNTDERIPNSTSSHTKTQKRSSTARRQGRRRRSLRADSGRFMIARLLVLVFLVLVVFEGNVVYRLFSHQVGTSVEIMHTGNSAQTEGLLQSSADSGIAVTTQEPAAQEPSSSATASVVALAGGPGESAAVSSPASSSPEPSAASSEQSSYQSSESLTSSKVVPYREPPVDDSYFHNAVFIGDSRMEGFRNSSGITQGSFLTAIGLSVNDMSRQIISTAEGNISVYQGLSGHQYDRIYLMLGANDLGYYPWEDFLPQFLSVLEQFHELQPKAIVYVCSVIYVDESKIAAGYEYDNNDNVRTINGYLLDACEKLWYSYYLNLNEIFSDGYGSLISGASSDGIHLYPDYLEMMHEYLKTHYIADEEFAAEMAKHPDDIANTASGEKELDASDASTGDESHEDGLIEDVSAS